MEYALLLAFVSVVAMSAMSVVGVSTSGTAAAVGEGLDRAASSESPGAAASPPAIPPPASGAPTEVVDTDPPPARTKTCPGKSAGSGKAAASSGKHLGDDCH